MNNNESEKDIVNYLGFNNVDELAVDNVWT